MEWGSEPALGASAGGSPVCSNLLWAGTLRELSHQGLTSHWHSGWMLAWSQLLPVNSIHTEAATAPASSSQETQFPGSQVGDVHGHCPGLEKGNQSAPGGRKVLRQHMEGWALGQDEHCNFSNKTQLGFALTAGHRRHQGCTSRDREVRERSRTNPAAVGGGRWWGGGLPERGDQSSSLCSTSPAQPCLACYHFSSPAQALPALGHGWMRHRGTADPSSPREALPQAVPSPPRLPSSP